MYSVIVSDMATGRVYETVRSDDRHQAGLVYDDRAAWLRSGPMASGTAYVVELRHGAEVLRSAHG